MAKLHPSIVVYRANKDAAPIYIKDDTIVPADEVFAVSDGLWTVQVSEPTKARRSPRNSELEWM